MVRLWTLGLVLSFAACSGDTGDKSTDKGADADTDAARVGTACSVAPVTGQCLQT